MKTSIQLSKHDQLQLEFKAEYPVDKNANKNEYSVDIYFFLPRNLAVNELTYTSSEFYNDFSEYIRFKTPEVPLSRLATPDNQLWHKLDNPENTDLETGKKYIKMFCSVFRSAMRDESRKLQNVLMDDDDIFHRYIEDAQTVLLIFRSRRNNFSYNADLLEFFDLASEYAGIMLSWHFSRFYKRLSAKQFSGKKAILSSLATVICREDTGRAATGAPSVPGPDVDNSLVQYRESILKKTMASILFLNMETRRDGMIMETVLMGFAAAVAMIFVTSIAFLWQGLYLQEFSLSFFVVWVAAYMFKDRIKFLLQNYLTSKRSRYSYDYKQKIFDNMNNAVGILREGFRYCDPEKLDPEVRNVRHKTKLTRTETGSMVENILLYRKKIELKSSSCSSFFNEFDVKGVVNICRLNIHHWLNKMDNPVRTVYTSDGEKLISFAANRDYHINIVIKVSSKDTAKAFSRYRLILNRDGIRKLEGFNT